MSGLTSRADAWRRRGAVEEIAGRQIFVYEQNGTGPPRLLLHGYPSSSYDWRLVIDRLGQRSLTAFDFLGFGLSEKPRDVRYSLRTQADIAEAVAQRHGDEPVTLIAHDMGTSVVTELLARALEDRLGFRVGSVLLLNGSMVIERASLTISQKALRSRIGPLVARLSNERMFRAQFARIFSEAHPLSPEEAADQWSLLAYRDGHKIVDRLIFYLHERVMYAKQWHGALREWPGELSFAWADQDPIATVAVLDAVRELRPHAPVARFAELGHYLQIEDPGAVAEIICRLDAT